MTALEILFITMIPILIVKLQFFLILVCLLFLVTVIILVNSQAPLQKKEWPQTLFLQLPQPLIIHMSVSFIFAYVHPITQRYIQRRAWKVLLLATIEDSLVTASTPIIHSEKVNRPFSVVSNILQNILSKRYSSTRNTSAITAVIKSSMKPWHGSTASGLLRGSGEEKYRTKENKGELW